MFEEIHSESHSRPNLFISSSKVICFWVLPVFHYGLTDDIRIHLILNALDSETTYHFRDRHPGELSIILDQLFLLGREPYGVHGPMFDVVIQKTVTDIL